MDNYLLFKYDAEAEQLSKNLGFEHTYFLDRDLVIISGTSPEILRKANSAGKKITLYLAEDDKKLRFVLERTAVKMVMNMEKMFTRDSVHYPKSGLDQIFCKIAAERDKTLCFSLSEIMNAKNPSVLLKRIAFNVNLCKKYQVQYLVGNFSKSKMEMRSAADLTAFVRMLEKKRIF